MFGSQPESRTRECLLLTAHILTYETQVMRRLYSQSWTLSCLYHWTCRSYSLRHAQSIDANRVLVPFHAILLKMRRHCGTLSLHIYRIQTNSNTTLGLWCQRLRANPALLAKEVQQRDGKLNLSLILHSAEFISYRLSLSIPTASVILVMS
jgi:hypothetical protein